MFSAVIGITGIYSPPFPADPQIAMWQHLMNVNVSAFFDRVKEGELDTLSEESLKVVLGLIESKSLVHSYVRHPCYYDAIRILIDKGYNLSALDSVGRSVLAYVEDLKFYQELKSKGALFVDPQRSELHYLSFWVNKPECPELMASISLEQYNDLKKKIRLYLLQRTEDKKLTAYATVIDGVITRLQDSSIGVVHFLTIPKKGWADVSAISCILRLIEKGLLKGPTIESLMTSPCYLKLLQNRGINIQVVLHRGPYSLGLHALMGKQKGLHMIMWCWGLLRANRIEKAADVLKCAGAVIYNRNCFDQCVRIFCLNHLTKLESEEKRTILSALEYSRIGGSNLVALVHFGLEFKDLLFTFFIYDSFDVLKENKGWYDLEQRDKEGYNALEYWTHQDFLKHFDPKERFYIWRNLFAGLVSLGLKLTDRHPYYRHCVEAFPHNFYYQALLAHHLIFGTEMNTSYEAEAILVAVKKIQDPYKPLPFAF